MAAKLLPKVERNRMNTRRFLTSEILDIFEDEMAELNERYKMTRPYRFSSDETLLQAMVGLHDDKHRPQLYSLYESGYAEIIHDHHAIGHGARHAKNILRTLFKRDISKERALEIGVHILLEVAEVDAMVDAFPQIAILDMDQKGKSRISILNEDKKGKFQIASEVMKPIKEKVQGVEQKRAAIFHAFMDGQTIKLDKAKEKKNVPKETYENASSKKRKQFGVSEKN